MQFQSFIIQINLKTRTVEMTFLRRLKHLVKITDFFYSTQMLRYEDQNQFKTFTGGIVSLAIIVTIIVGFASMILNTLDLNTFTISTEIVKNKVPTSSAVQINNQSSFRFAIQIWRQDITDSKRYFDITFRLKYENNGLLNATTYYPLQPCTKDHFSSYSEITDHFQNLMAEEWLCPTLNTTLILQGKYSSANYNQYVIQVSACKNETDPSRPCASPYEIEKYFLQNGNFFYFTFYFTNTQINPDKKDYKQYYFEDQAYAVFGSNVGCETFLYFTDYTVQTDYSIWPFSNIATDTGVFAADLGINHPFQTNINGTYITWYIAKSTNSIIYSRQVQKLSAVFSFMGGMIGAVSAVLFIIKIYTNVAFEFSVAFEIFKPPEAKTQNPLNTQTVLQMINENTNENSQSQQDRAAKKRYHQMSINFFSFLRFYTYKLYDFLGYQYDSPEIKYAQQCKDQILKQLDIKKLLKRIIFIEHCLTKILDNYHLDVLQLKKPETPAEIRQIRLKCESIVDQQLQEESNIEAEKSSLSSIKREQMVEVNQTQSPNNMNVRLSQQFCRRHKRLPEMKLKHRGFKIQQPSAFLDNRGQLIVQNVEPIKEDRAVELEPAAKKLYRETTTIKGAEILKIKQKRESNLVRLLKTAEQGNELSNRLFKKLDNQTKQRAVRYCKKTLFTFFDRT